MTIRFRPTPFVFISSVGEECKIFRESATRAALRSRFLPVRMETWSAEARSSNEACKRHLSECNVMILILTDRYGSLHPESGKSYTEMEYDSAKELNIPVLAFLAEHPNLPTDKLDPNDLIKAKKFREQLGNSIQGRFNNEHELELLVFQSLQEWLRDLAETNLKHDISKNVEAKNVNISYDVNNLDAAAFKRLQQIINSDWIQDFESLQLTSPQFVYKSTRNQLLEYRYESEKAENEFLNETVRDAHENFLKSINGFLHDTARITVAHDGNNEVFVICTKAAGQRKWIDNYDEKYEKEVNIISDRAENIVDNYKNFIRICRLNGIFK